jgi:hypothetical protein
MANKFLNVLDMTLNKIIQVAPGVAETDAVNKGQLDTAVSNAVGSLSAALEYKGVFDASAEDFSALEDASQGDFYIVSATGTIDEVLFTNGDHIVINKDVEGVPTIADIDLIKNTEFPDMVFEDREQTLTNKTIEDSTFDAAENTVSNLDTTMLAEGVLVVETDALDDAYVALDDTLLSGKAVEARITKRLEARVFVDEIVGDGEALSFALQHELGTEDVLIQVVDNETGFIAYPTVKIEDEDNVVLLFGNAPAGESELGAGDEDKYTVRVLALNSPAGEY